MKQQLAKIDALLAAKLPATAASLRKPATARSLAKSGRTRAHQRDEPAQPPHPP